MVQPELCYVFDTLCGWCYGAAPAVSWARKSFGDALTITLLHGGLFTGENSRPMAEMRPIALEHDKRIHELTGRPFSDAYLEKIVMNDDVVHDSTPTAIAHQVVKRALQNTPTRLLDFLHATQYARFVEGQDLTNWSTYVPLVKPLAISSKQFFDGFYDVRTRVSVDAEFQQARDLMEEVGAEGFPSFILKAGGGSFLIPHARLLKAPESIVSRIREHI